MSEAPSTTGQEGHLPEEEYRQIEEGVNGFYDRLAEQLRRT
jgi:hypothetical protein